MNDTMALNDKLYEKKRIITEIVATVMVFLIAAMPGIAIISPGSYGKIFKCFGIAELAVLVLLAFFNLCMSYVGRRELGLGAKTAEVFRGIFRAFSSNKQFILLFVAYIIALISSCVAEDVQRAFWGTDFRVDGFFMYSVFAAIFVFGSLIKDPLLKKIIYVMYIISFIINGTIVLQQFLGVIGTVNADSCPEYLLFLKNLYSHYEIRTGHFYKGLTGAFYNSNHVGYFLAMCSMLLSAAFVISRTKLSRVLLAVGCVYSLWLVIINDTFGCYIATFVTLVLLAVFAFVRTGRGKWSVRACVPLIMFVTLSIVTTLAGSETVLSNIVNLKSDIADITADDSEADNAGSGRWELWVATVDMISEKPLSGFGPDNLNPQYKSRNLNITRAHNEYLEHPVNCGVPYAVFYFFGVFYIIFRRVRRMQTVDDARKYLIPLSVCVAYMISAFVGVFLFYTACHFFVMLSLLKD